eukprot:gene24503-10496_t
MDWKDLKKLQNCKLHHILTKGSTRTISFVFSCSLFVKKQFVRQSTPWRSTIRCYNHSRWLA